MDISDCEGGDGRCTAYGRTIRRGKAAGGPGTRPLAAVAGTATGPATATAAAVTGAATGGPAAT
nr:hypothetical protein StreXyl84_19350 [Streptomyces sp. Xyl84]